MQFSLFYDYYALVDSCSFLKKYDAIFKSFDMVYDQPDYPAFGRKGYPRSAYFKAFIYKQSENIKYVSDLVRDLKSRPIIAQMCGFCPGCIPDASRFSRFLSGTNNSDIEDLFHKSGKLLLENEVISLDVIIADSKPIKAYTKHNNPKNPNRKLDKTIKIKRNPKATLSYYSYLKQPLAKKKKEFTWFWGFRTHVLLSKEGVPLIECTLPNNRTDGKVVKTMLKKLKRVYGQKKGRIFLGDAGYDDRELYKFIVEEMKAEPFIPLNTRYKTSDYSFTDDGIPICEADLPMKYAGICAEEHRTRKKFRCPIIAGNKKEKAKLTTECPVKHEKSCSGKCYGCTAFTYTTCDYRKLVPRESKRYKTIYKSRTEVERYFSRLGPREVEEISTFKYRSVRNQMTLAHLSLSLTAVAAALVLKQPDKIRCPKTLADAA